MWYIIGIVAVLVVIWAKFSVNKEGDRRTAEELRKGDNEEDD